MLKIMCLDPVTMAATKEEGEYMGKFLSKDTELVLDVIDDGPYTIQCEYDEAMSQPHVIESCIKAEKNGIDGIFVNCFGDPGVRAAREVTGIPIFGGFEPVMLTAMGVADRVAIITVLDSVMPLISNNIMKAGFGDRVVSLRNVGIPVADLSDKDKLVPALVSQAEAAIRENRAEVIVLGCTAMIDVAETTEQIIKKKGYDIPVLEPAQTALKYVEMYAQMGISHSRLTYGAVN